MLLLLQTASFVDQVRKGLDEVGDVVDGVAPARKEKNHKRALAKQVSVFCAGRRERFKTFL
jgi:hypothetical protein